MQRFGFDLDDHSLAGVDVVGISSGGGFVDIPGGTFLLRASFDRLGPDLVLSHEDQVFLLKDYFRFENPPDLLSSGGSVINSDLANKLAGPPTPGQFAQLSGVASDTSVGGQSIGKITTLEGQASITRADGTTVSVESGLKVFQNDIVETNEGGTIGIVFIDDTSFVLGESGRIVIDELIYSPSENEGSMAFSVVQGVFSFVSGEIAKTGSSSMVVKTPVATIGVRGTKVAGKAAAEGEVNTITLLPDQGGAVGEISVRNSEGFRVLNQPFQTTSLDSAFNAPSFPQVIPESAVQNLYGTSVIDLVSTQAATGPQIGTDSNEDSANRADERSEDDSEVQDEGLEEEGEGGEEASEEEEGLEEEGLEEEIEGEPLGDEDPEELEASREEGEPVPVDGEGEPVPVDGEGEPVPVDGEGEPLSGEAREGLEADGEDGVPEEGARIDEEERPRDGEIARDAYEEAIEAGGTEEEALRAAAEAVGQGEAFEQALAEGADEGEALRRAEDVAREQERDRYGPREEDVQLARGEIDRVLREPGAPRGEGAIEDVIQQAVEVGGEDHRSLDAARDAVYGVFDDAFRGDASSADVAAFASIIGQTDTAQTIEGRIFTEALISGQSIDTAFVTLHEAFRPDHETTDWRTFDFIESNPFAQGFNPFIQAQILIETAFDTIRSEIEISEGTISAFDEVIELTTGSDFVTGSALNTSFLMRQGTTLGGNDTILDLGGQDEITFANLENIFLSFDAATVTMTYATFDNALSGSTILPSGANAIEQVFANDPSGTSVRLLIPDDDPTFKGFIFSGTSGNDVVSLVGDGTTAPEITAGSISIDIDNIEVLGSIIFGGAGDDTITGGDIVRAGSGDDTIIVNSRGVSMFGESGSDLFVLGSPAVTQEITINAGTDPGDTDTIQFGTTSSAQNQTFTLDFVTIIGVNKVSVIPSNTVVESFRNFWFTLDEIETPQSTTNLTIRSISNELNLSNTTIGSGVTQLEGTRSSLGSGVDITDGRDDIGRTLLGTAARDELRGRGGGDTFIPGDGEDTIIGGTGNDKILINAESNVTDRKSISGGAGTDSLVVNSTSISELITERDFQTTTLETIDLRGGSSSGVTLSVRDAASIDNVSVGVEIIGDGSSDKVVFRNSGFQVRDQFTFNGIDAIEMASTARREALGFSSDTQITNASTFSITGAQIVNGGVHELLLRESDFNSSSTPSFDFSNISLSNIRLRADQSSESSTIGFNENTRFGNLKIEGSFRGNDILEYKSALTAGNSDSIPVSNDLAITRINSQGFTSDHIRTDTNGVIDFTFSRLTVEANDSTESAILSDVESLLESTDIATNLTGLSSSGGAVLAADANAELLLILHSQSGSDSVMVLYQEGSTADEDYANELSLIGVFNESEISNSSIL
jgi:hypothetical protein